MTGFQPDTAFDAGSVLACDWPLSQVRLQDDARFPWLILIPRLEGVVELDELAAMFSFSTGRMDRWPMARATAPARTISSISTAR